MTRRFAAGLASNTVSILILLALLVSLSSSVSWARDVPFGAPQSVTDSLFRPLWIGTADMDSDGDLDVICCPNKHDAVWCPNAGGGTFASPEQSIDTDSWESPTGFTADIDGDGDQDFLYASYEPFTHIGWYPNTGGGAFASPEQMIDNSDMVTSLWVCDLDADGDADVVVACDGSNKIHWYPNTGGGTFTSPEQVISTSVDKASSICACDVDGDGDLDVIFADDYNDTIAWCPNTGGGAFALPEQIVTTSAGGVCSVFTCDMDGDGDPDILAASPDDGVVGWFENTDGAGAFSTQRVISSVSELATSVVAADLDFDGDFDVVASCASDDAVSWFENVDGAGAFGPQRIIVTDEDGADGVRVVDLDGDGDLDIAYFSESGNTVAWCENETIHRSSLLTPVDLNLDTDVTRSVALADFDGDGDLDAFVGNTFDGPDSVWFNDGLGNFTDSGQSLGTGDTEGLAVGDVDGDGDLDVIAGSLDWTTRSSLWLNDGSGLFTSSGLTLPTRSKDVQLADLDGDGDLDAFFARQVENLVYLNNGSGLFTDSGQSLGSSNSYSVGLGDIDADGDLDAVVGNYGVANRVWLNDGSGTFTDSGQTLDRPNYAYDVELGDVDRDGDLDAVMGGSTYNTLWLNDGTGIFVNSGEDLGRQANDIALEDLDADGDLDVFVVNYNPPSRVYFNDGTGSFPSANSHQVNTLTYTECVDMGDVDRDGDLDALVGLYANPNQLFIENGAQFGLTSYEYAPASIGMDSSTTLFQINCYHRGIAQDASEEVVSMTFRFESSPGVPMTTAEANAVIDSMSIKYGSSTVGEVDTFALDASGEMTVPLVDGDPYCSLSPGGNTTFYASVTTANGSWHETLPEFLVTHVQSDGIAEDGVHSIVMTTEPTADLATNTIAFQYRNISCSDDRFDFGPIPIASAPTSPESIILTNTGTIDLTVYSAQITGTDGSEFEIIAGGDPGTLAAQATHEIQVIFDPQTTGSKEAYLSITSNDPDDATVEIELAGIALGPDITVTGGPLDFGAIDLDNAPTAAQSITIANDGDQNLTITSVTITGAGSSEFTITADTGANALAPGASREVHVTFDPSATGSFTASLDIVSDDPDESTVTVPISGTAIDQEITITPVVVDFGMQHIGAGPLFTTVTIANDGSADLIISSVTLHASGAPEFTVNSDTGENGLAPGADREIQIAFDPVAAVSSGASLEIVSDDTDEATLVVPISGAGGFSEITVTPASLEFGLVDLDDAPALLSVAIFNSGAARLGFTGDGIILAGIGSPEYAVTGSPASTSIAAGASREVEIQFDPRLLGNFLADLTITTDASAESVVTISLSGTGYQPTSDLVDMILGVQAVPPSMEQCDVNSDGILDAADVVENVNTFDNP